MRDRRTKGALVAKGIHNDIKRLFSPESGFGEYYDLV